MALVRLDSLLEQLRAEKAAADLLDRDVLTPRRPAILDRSSEMSWMDDA